MKLFQGCQEIYDIQDMRTVKNLIFKYSVKPRSVYCSIYPLINICCYLCLIPYNLKKNNHTEFRTQHPKWFRTFNIILIVPIIVLMLWNMSSLAVHCRNEDTSLELKYFQEEAINIMALCGILSLLFNAKELLQVFRKLERVDESLKLLSLTPNYSDTYVNITLTLIILLVYISITVFWTIMECSGLVSPLFLRKCTLTNSVEKIILKFYILMAQLRYYQYLVLVEGREKLLNGFLKDLISRKVRKYNGWIDQVAPVITFTDEIDNDGKINMLKGMDLSDMVNHVANIHSKLADVAISINKIFEKQQFLKFFITFATTLFAMYFIVIYVSRTDDVDIDKPFLYGAISNALEIWLLVYITSETSFQFDTCPRLLHKLRNNNNEARLHRTVEILSVRMYQNRIDFNILGLFSLKYCLLFNMMAEIMTYLAILIQFNTHRMTTTNMTNNNHK